MLPSWIARIFRIPQKSSHRPHRAARRLPTPTFRPCLEILEDRTLLTASMPSAVLPISVAASGSTMGNNTSTTASSSISANGQYEVFSSTATNLVNGVTINNTGQSNVYERNLSTGVTSLVSVNVAVGDYAVAPAVTADGRYVVFVSDDDNLTGDGNTGFSQELFVRDMTSGQTFLVYNGTNLASPNGDISIGESNGQLVISYLATDSSGNSQVYVSTLALDSTTGDINAGSLSTMLISADSSGNGGNSNSLLPMVSQNGNTVAFLSFATNLSGQINSDGHLLLFSYNLGTGTLTQVTPAIETNTAVALSSVSISNNGDLAYVMNDADSNGDSEVYAWNASTNTNTVIPTVTYPNGSIFGFGPSGYTAISGDGSTVAFEEGGANTYIYASSNWQSGTATVTQISPTLGSQQIPNAVAGATMPSLSDNGQVIAYVVFYTTGSSQLYVDNNGTTTEVNAATGGDGNGNVGPAAVSGDGSTVVFDSQASNQLPSTYDFTPGENQVYAYNVADNTTSLVSAKAPGLFAVDGRTTDQGGQYSGGLSASLSDNGQNVAFYSVANDLLGSAAFDSTNPGSGGIYSANVFAENVQQGTPTLISGYGPESGEIYDEQVVISGDGSTVAYSNEGVSQIFSRNWQAATPTTTLVSVNSAGQAANNNGYTSDPSISDNGQVIAFDSQANNLTANDPNANGYNQIFVRNLATNTTTLASSNSAGTDGGNGTSGPPILSANGNVVVYNSYATDLVSGVTVPSSSTENVYGFSLTTTPTPTNVSSDVSVTRGGFRYDFAAHEFVQTVTITNTSGSALLGPLALQLTNLSGNATLAGTSLGGSVNNNNPSNPYFDFVLATGQLAAGQSITVTLYFKDPTFQSITYGTQVWQNI